MYLLPTLNFVLAISSLALFAFAVALYVDYFVFKQKYFKELMQKIVWPLIMFLTISSVVMSLVYSEYFGFIPCSLCWLQRIAIYPQALLSVLAYKLEDSKLFPIYGIALSIFGFVVAVYHYIYQLIPKETLASGIMPCLADGSNADCASKVIDLFGFVSFPFLSAVTFAFLIIAYLYLWRSTKTS
jgi:disulfide bond formation protein DsbB